jgi:hypothetical protein
MDNIHANSILVLCFIAAAFIYLLAGSIAFLLAYSGLASIELGTVFIGWFFGFVMMMVFGLSYMFVPGFAHARYASYKMVAIEYAFLNIGIVAFMAFGFANMHRGALYGAAIVFAGIAMHIYNMAAMLIRRRARKPGMASQP